MKNLFNFITFILVIFFLGCDDSSISSTFMTGDTMSLDNSLPQDTAKEVDTHLPPECDHKCDDGIFCNGAEACKEGICVKVGIPPCGVGDIADSRCNEANNECGSCANRGPKWCDDGVTFTTETCESLVEGTPQCVYEITADWCGIGNTGYITNTTNPDDPCQICDPDNDQEWWTQVPNCPVVAVEDEDKEVVDTDTDNETHEGEVEALETLDTDSEVPDEFTLPDTEEDTNTFDVEEPETADSEIPLDVTEPPPDEGEDIDEPEEIKEPADNGPDTEDIVVIDLCEDVNCDDENPCTENGVCDPATGICTFTNNQNECTDNNACTTDACDLETGCEHTGLNCDDGNDCTFDTCDPSVGCKIFAEPKGEPCDDNSVCTNGDVCIDKSCIGKHKECTDNNPCTDDSCDSLTGCAYTPNTETCSDDNACTIGDICADSACASGPSKDCDDNDICTIDSCDPLMGCVNQIRDTDLDGLSDCDDTDDDNDGVDDGQDNCPLIANSDQLDKNLDGVGDPCDPHPSKCWALHAADATPYMPANYVSYDCLGVCLDGTGKAICRILEGDPEVCNVDHDNDGSRGWSRDCNVYGKPPAGKESYWCFDGSLASTCADSLYLPDFTPPP